MGRLIVLIALLILTIGSESSAQSTVASSDLPSPLVLLELFTAEGCSSCPPADDFAAQLDAVQPIPGAHIVVLSEHMNYWNKDWPDPYSSASLTARQTGYIHARGMREPYTPQLLLDGGTELHLQDRTQVAELFKRAASAAKIGVRLAAVSIDPRAPASVHARIEVNGQAQVGKADVFVALALDHVESKVLRGENRGKTLTHVGVVVDLLRVGSLVPGQEFFQDFKLTLRPLVDASNTSVVVFVQQPGFGKIVGAALGHL